MKEAAIKAHTYRSDKLLMTQVSVLRWGAKVKILIDPPSATITMDSRVASLRGLKHSRLRWKSRSATASSNSPTGDLFDGKSVKSTKIYKRGALIKEEDRQVAEGSISHDGGFVIATCMALNESGEQSEKSDAITDDGSGDPIHNPVWGDEGFRRTENLEGLKEAAFLSSETKGPEARSVLFSGAKTSKSSKSAEADKFKGCSLFIKALEENTYP